MDLMNVLCSTFWNNKYPSTFVTYMKKVFKEHIGVQALVYLDNIIISSTTKEQHLRDARVVLQTLKDNQLYMKPYKWQFF